MAISANHWTPADRSSQSVPIDREQHWQTFRRVIESRRAVRAFDTSVEELPDADIHECLDMALLAPSTSNLQPWQFVRVKSKELKAKMVPLCLGQPAAATATEFIVCVGRTDRWREFRDRMLAEFERAGFQFPRPFDGYYKNDVPIMYGLGPFGILGPLKRALLWGVRLTRPFSSVPCSAADMRLWALKNTAFATENLMLALAAKGFASCPMDGFDKGRVRKLLKLPAGAHPLLVLAVGKASAEDKVWGPRMRFSRDLFVSEA